jgi:threonylcarbamoyladenosine tRNA methylthiotransferase MtaB
MPIISPQHRRVIVHSIGCRLNQAESALLSDRFAQLGFVPVSLGEPTDVLVVNSCSVTDQAESDCRKVVRQVLRNSPNATVAVTGCYAQTGIEGLRTFKDIDLIVGTQFKMRLPEYLKCLPVSAKASPPEVIHTKKIDYENFVIEGVGQYSTTRANLKIQDGCQFMCAFCLIPFARGRERSRRAHDTLREARALAERGHRELVLTGVNIGQYRHDGMGLVDLIQRLEEVKGIDRIRISSIEPTTIPDALLEYMGTSEKLCRYLHVPIQSGDDAILKAMNRRYSVRDFIGFIDKAVEIVPDLCLGTDVMVGFPGENEEQFLNTQAVIQDLPLAYLHVFSFSERPGTAASRMNHHVPARTIRTRSRKLADLSRIKRLAYYQRFVGRTVAVLFESRNHHGVWTGLTDNYVRVGVQSSEEFSNTLRPIVITGISDGLAVGHVRDQQASDRKGDSLPLARITLKQ